jgi:acyl-CoA synthetase (AMP-forming)/AMP-acid ligase II
MTLQSTDADLTLAAHFEQVAKRFSDKPACSCLGRTMTFSELEEKSRTLASWLQTSSQQKAALVVVNTTPLYTPREMQHQYSGSGATAIAVLSDIVPKLQEIIQQTSISNLITVDKPEGYCAEQSGTSTIEQLNCVALTDILGNELPQNLNPISNAGKQYGLM